MSQRVPVTDFDFNFTDGKLSVKLNGKPFDLHLLQKVEIVLDAQAMTPFVRLTVLSEDTGVHLGKASLEIQQGDSTKPTFAGVPRGPAYHGSGPDQS